MLQQIKERLQKASPGPWNVDGKLVYKLVQSTNSEHLVNRFSAGVQSARQLHEAQDAELDANAQLMAHAPTDIAFLIEEVERLREVEGILARSLGGSANEY